MSPLVVALLFLALLAAPLIGEAQPAGKVYRIKRGVDGVVLVDDPVLIDNSRQLAELTARNRIPAIGFAEYAHAGGLMSYAVNLTEAWRRAAVFVDKILKGATPGSYPSSRPHGSTSWLTSKPPRRSASRSRRRCWRGRMRSSSSC